jgi:chemotaxis protein methyltransferase CheR
MVSETQPIDLKVMADNGMISSDKAVSLGLIVTELVINAIKYAFPTATVDASITVEFASTDDDWSLTVADNGVGKLSDAPPSTVGGLGTVIVQALVKQLEAKMVVDGVGGMRVSIARTGQPKLDKAA